MTQIYLIRHGQAFGNVTPVLNGPKGDKGLTPLGIQQAERLRDRILATGEIKADVFISSTLPRAAQTAQIIAPALDLPIIWDEEVQEMRFSPEADGMSASEANAIYGVPNMQNNPFTTLYGGENWGQFMLRVGMALHRISEQHAGKTIVIVAHGGVVDGSLVYFSRLNTLQLPPLGFHTHNTSITHWQKKAFLDPTKLIWTLMKYNDDLHTRDIGAAERINWHALAKQAKPEEQTSVPLPTEPDKD